MQKRLLSFIECKKCNRDFNLDVFEENATEIKSGVLYCKKCGTYFLIVNYIPRFVSKDIFNDSEFEIKFADKIKRIVPNFNIQLNNDNLKILKKQTAKYFGYEWTCFDKHGFNDEVYNEQFEKKIFHEKTLFRSQELKGKLVLDGGCGNGRYTYQARKCGAEVFGFDLSRAVESAYKNTRHLGNVHIIQADMFNLPFKKEVFDFVFSIGVIHHTGNTKKAFRSLLLPLKKEGTISITCYHKGNIIWEFNDWLIRLFTTKLSIPNLIIISKFLAKSCKLLWFLEKPLNLLFRWEPNVSIMYDWYSAPIATHHTYPEIYSWCKEFSVYLTEDLRWEKKEWIRNIKFIRRFVAPDWAATFRGLKEQGYNPNPKHIYDKLTMNWDG